VVISKRKRVISKPAWIIRRPELSGTGLSPVVGAVCCLCSMLLQK
jgi:hypothetical protein